MPGHNYCILIIPRSTEKKSVIKTILPYKPICLEFYLQSVYAFGRIDRHCKSFFLPSYTIARVENISNKLTDKSPSSSPFPGCAIPFSCNI